MIIRYYKKEDEQQIQELAKKHNILLPDEGMMMIAEDSDGKIVGILNLRQVAMIEPLIADNPMAGRKMLDEMVMFLKTTRQSIVRAIVGDEVRDLALKDGFEQVFENKHIIEKYIPPLTDGELHELKMKSLLKNPNIN